jgi:hypothetical protein
VAAEKPKTEGPVTPQRLMEELAQIALADYSDFVRIVEERGEGGEVRLKIELKPTGRIPKKKRAAIASIRQAQGGIELKLHDKLQALRELAKMLEDQQEKSEGEGGLQIIDDI